MKFVRESKHATLNEISKVYRTVQSAGFAGNFTAGVMKEKRSQLRGHERRRDMEIMVLQIAVVCREALENR